MTDFSKVENCPVAHISEKYDKNLAFVIHRNKNKNVVVYSANVDEATGELNPTEPLKVYWVMFEKDNAPTEGLNMIERNTAYGVTSSAWEGKPGHYKVELASLKDRVLDVSMEDGKVFGRSTVNGMDSIKLDRVFVKSTTSWGMPKVESIEIHGTDASGASVKETKKC